MQNGFYLKGSYLNKEMHIKDGQPRGWYIGVAVGVNSYKLRCDFDPGDYSMGDDVLCRVRSSVYKGVLYYYCESIELADPA